MLLAPFQLYNSKECIIQNSLVIKCEELPACIDLVNWPNYFRQFKLIVNRFEAGDNRFQNFSQFPALLFTTLHKFYSYKLTQQATQ